MARKTGTVKSTSQQGAEAPPSAPADASPGGRQVGDGFVLVDRGGRVWTGETWVRDWGRALVFDREPDPDRDARQEAENHPMRGVVIVYVAAVQSRKSRD